jgi:hypothetical protein
MIHKLRQLQKWLQARAIRDRISEMKRLERDARRAAAEATHQLMYLRSALARLEAQT